MSTTADFNFGDYTAPKALPMLLFSQVSAFNRDAWAVRPRALSHPLEQFWAERFLVEAGEEDEYQIHSKAAEKGMSGPNSERPMHFSLDGLEGCWLRFGGGQRICPGHHFAKTEILGAFVVLLSKFEWQLANAELARAVKPDTWRVPFRTMPLSSTVPVRFRQKGGSDRL